MNSEQFVDAIREFVIPNAAAGIARHLKSPAGRKPADDDLAKSAWYHLLSESDKEMLHSVIRESVDLAIFDFLCVLDGSQVIEDGEDKGKLQLRYLKNGAATVLTPPEGDALHELF